MRTESLEAVVAHLLARATSQFQAMDAIGAGQTLNEVQRHTTQAQLAGVALSPISVRRIEQLYQACAEAFATCRDRLQSELFQVGTTRRATHAYSKRGAPRR